MIFIDLRLQTISLQILQVLEEAPQRYLSGGYALIRRSECPISMSSGQIKRSRYIMWLLGCRIDNTTHVHHRDENQSNDLPTNLEVKDGRDHNYEHSSGRVHTTTTRKKMSKTGRGFPNHCSICGLVGATKVSHGNDNHGRSTLDKNGNRQKWSEEFIQNRRNATDSRLTGGTN